MLPRQAKVQVWLCCRSCNSASLWCSTCGFQHTIGGRPIPSAGFPSSTGLRCRCGTSITVEVLGFQLNPTGDRPATEVLSDVLPGLERALRQSHIIEVPGQAHCGGAGVAEVTE